MGDDELADTVHKAGGNVAAGLYNDADGHCHEFAEAVSEQGDERRHDHREGKIEAAHEGILQARCARVAFGTQVVGEVDTEGLRLTISNVAVIVGFRMLYAPLPRPMWRS